VTSYYEDVNNAKNEMTRRLDEAQQYANRVLPLAKSDAYQLTQQAQAYKAETIADAEAEVAVFKAVYEKYQAQPEVSRTRMTIEAIEKMLGSAGKIVVVDGDSNVLQVLNLGDEPAQPQGGAL
jgi:membrane protease subunit HflK